mmetsp:Transcript_57385/g.153016  ORF Transcript_57385/g.153016 Transcript_57385/m.153016 type:complete len:211 (+) Transcript_57385:172-804(+)
MWPCHQNLTLSQKLRILFQPTLALIPRARRMHRTFSTLFLDRRSSSPTVMSKPRKRRPHQHRHRHRHLATIVPSAPWETMFLSPLSVRSDIAWRALPQEIPGRITGGELPPIQRRLRALPHQRRFHPPNRQMISLHLRSACREPDSRRTSFARHRAIPIWTQRVANSSRTTRATFCTSGRSAMPLVVAGGARLARTWTAWSGTIRTASRS